MNIISCEHHTTIKQQLSTYETSMKINTFTKGNEDSSCEQHTTFKIKYLRMKSELKVYTMDYNEAIKLLIKAIALEDKEKDKVRLAEIIPFKNIEKPDQKLKSLAEKNTKQRITCFQIPSQSY